ncbi:hypothetical protein OAI55_01095 [Nitrosopumilus sp.]|nr:hypothetical protein [Nitrosopumilus sp.]
MSIPCKLPILKNISYLSGAMFTFSLFIPMITETPSEANTSTLSILSVTGMIISFGIAMRIRKKLAKKSRRF